MSENHPKKKCYVVGHQTHDDDDEDRISNLPESVIEAILKCLPTQDVERTSVLGRKWRYRWAKLPQLILDKRLCEKSLVRTGSDRVTLPMIVYKYLLLHEGPIIKFSLHVPQIMKKTRCHDEVVNRLMFFLSRKGVEDLTLESDTTVGVKALFYRLPQSVFKCHQLRHLYLGHCSIETIPPDSKGFGELISLKLCRVSISEVVLASLISTCPLLEDLELFYMVSARKIVIDAPKLNAFKLRGSVSSVIIKNASVLRSVCTDAVILAAGDNSIDRFFSGFPALENLCICHCVAEELLVTGGVPKKLQIDLVHLKTLKLINMRFYASAELKLIICMIRSSPNLNYLEVNLGSCIYNFVTRGIVALLEDQVYADMKLNQLKVVILRNLSGSSGEMKLVKLILEKSPVLEKMLIRRRQEIARDKLEFLVQLAKFRRASKEAEVIYEH